MHIDLHKIPQASPDDISGLDDLITQESLSLLRSLPFLAKLREMVASMILLVGLQPKA
jgi:hypothetical protein